MDVETLLLKTAILRLVVPDGATDVVVTFESAAGDIDRADQTRKGFGEDFLVKNGYACLGVMPNTQSWYRDRVIQTALAGPEVAAWLARFARVHAYGSSMGAFGAMAFGRTLGATNIIALGPVSTLRSALVPWETRFSKGRHLNWTGTLSDAVAQLIGPGRLWMFYDPLWPDALHAERILRGATMDVAPVRIAGAQHGVARHLLEWGALSHTIRACLAGDAAGLQEVLEATGLFDTFIAPGFPVTATSAG